MQSGHFHISRATRILLWVTLAAGLIALIGLRGRGVSAAPPESQRPFLTMATKPIEPFVFVNGDEQPSGFSIDLWTAIALEAGLEYQFVVFETVSESLDAVINETADAAIAAITITEDRETKVNFSVPYYRSGLGILTVRTDYSSFLDSARNTVTPSFIRLLLILLLVIVVAGHIIWLFERRRNEQFPTSYFRGVWEGIWWAAVTVTTVGYGDKTPLGPFGRIFGLFWMFAGLFIIANFTANVTATLTAERLATSIAGPEDLPGHTIATVAGSTSEEWLVSQGLPHTSTTLIDEAYDLLLGGQVNAVVYDFPVLQYYTLQANNETLVLVGEPFNTELYGIALPQSSPYQEQINLALLRLIEDGTVEALHMRWFGTEGGI